jgi:hypothetical protein
MPRINKTPDNPHGLSPKQQAVIIDVVDNIRAGKGLDVPASVNKIYQTKHPRMIASRNLSRINFREAMIDELRRYKVIGKNGKVTEVLAEGLNAIKITRYGDQKDYMTRLAYVQEINKVIGVYAPDRVDKRVMTLNVDIEPSELDKRIQELKNQVL